MKFVYVILALAVLGVGMILLPPLKAVTTTIFESVTYDFPPFLQLMVDLWPVLLLLAFVVGAVFLARGRQ